MSLQDIRKAITAQADEEIATLQREHQQTLRQRSEENEQEIAEGKHVLLERFDDTVAQMRVHRAMQLSIQKRNIVLRKKQELLSRLYEGVIDRLCALSPEKLEQLLSHCLAQCPQDGVVRAAKDHTAALQKLLAGKSGISIGESVAARGGFIFVSGDQERDYTFEHLVSAYLRPETEVETAEHLFSSARS